MECKQGSLHVRQFRDQSSAPKVTAWLNLPLNLQNMPYGQNANNGLEDVVYCNNICKHDNVVSLKKILYCCLFLCGIHWSQLDYSHKRPVIQTFGVLFLSKNVFSNYANILHCICVITFAYFNVIQMNMFIISKYLALFYISLFVG